MNKMIAIHSVGRLNIENLRLTKKVLLSLIDDSYDTRNCPEIESVKHTRHR